MCCLYRVVLFRSNIFPFCLFSKSSWTPCTCINEKQMCIIDFNYYLYTCMLLYFLFFSSFSPFLLFSFILKYIPFFHFSLSYWGIHILQALLLSGSLHPLRTWRPLLCYRLILYLFKICSFLYIAMLFVTLFLWFCLHFCWRWKNKLKLKLSELFWKQNGVQILSFQKTVRFSPQLNRKVT